MRSEVAKRIISETPKEVKERVRIYAKLIILFNKIFKTSHL